MGNIISEQFIIPICKCCDDFVKYVLNGCQSECRLCGSCCTCAINIPHDAINVDEYIDEDNHNSPDKHTHMLSSHDSSKSSVSSI